MDAAARTRRLIEERLALHQAEIARAYRGTSISRVRWFDIIGARIGECRSILAALDAMEGQPAPPEPARG